MRGNFMKRVAPWHPAPSTLQRCPQFREFWDQLTAAIASPESGVATEVLKKRDKESAESRTVKIRYLARLFLLEQLKEFNSDARNEPDEGDTTKNLSNDSLHNALAVAGAMQILKLSEKEESEMLHTTHDENVTQLVGDASYLLGLKPRHLTQRLMNIADSIAANQKLIPDFEVHIKEFAQHLCRVFRPQLQPGQNVQEAILEMIDSKVLSSRAMPNNGDVEDALNRLHEAHEAIKSTWETTSELLEHHVLGRHLKADEERLEYQQAMIELHAAHTDCLLHNIRNATYSTDTLKALDALNASVDRETTAALEEVQLLKDQLEQCERLGPHYLKLAREFQMTLDNLEHAKQTLRDMEVMEDDLDEAMQSDSKK